MEQSSQDLNKATFKLCDNPNGKEVEILKCPIVMMVLDCILQSVFEFEPCFV